MNQYQCYILHQADSRIDTRLTENDLCPVSVILWEGRRRELSKILTPYGFLLYYFLFFSLALSLSLSLLVFLFQSFLSFNFLCLWICHCLCISCLCLFRASSTFGHHTTSQCYRLGGKQIGAVIGVIGHYRRLSLVLFWTLNFKLAAHYAKYHVYTTPIITVLVLLVITTGIEYSPVLNLLHQAKYADTTVHHVSHAHNTYYIIALPQLICDTCGLWLSMDSHLIMTPPSENHHPGNYVTVLLKVRDLRCTGYLWARVKIIFRCFLKLLFSLKSVLDTERKIQSNCKCKLRTISMP